MKDPNLHATDEQLLLQARGESAAEPGNRVKSHMESCSRCCGRFEELESALAAFGTAHRNACDAQLGTASESRHRLMAQIAASAHTQAGLGKRENGRFLSSSTVLVELCRPATLACAAIALSLVLLVIWLSRPDYAPQTMSAALGHWDEPDLRLTPGATVPMTSTQICGTATAKSQPVVPVALRRRVFELYGVMPPRPDAYEVDYLITPELGGATDIRNLWPEPYQDTMWNARVKDQLEDRLHRMVCRGDVDLATAQHDISTDWIGAYRKYFHAERPVVETTPLHSSRFRRPFPLT